MKGGVIGFLVLAGWAATALSGPAAGEAAYEEIAVKDGGTLTGVVRFTGAPPKLAPIAVNKNRDVCGDDKPSEALIVGPDRGVKGSVILLEGVTKGKKATGDVVIDNNKCLFIGHVTAVNEWAVDVGLQARMQLRTSGYLGGRHTKPPVPYLPSGTLL